MPRPSNFRTLIEERDLHYRIESDGSVTLTGFQRQGIISVTLPDGSKLQGGISSSGQVFGDRLIPGENGITRKPMQWFESDEITTVQPFNGDTLPTPTWTTWSLTPQADQNSSMAPESEISPLDLPPLSETSSAPVQPSAPAPKIELTKAAPTPPIRLRDENFEALKEALGALEAAQQKIDELRRENRKLRLRSKR